MNSQENSSRLAAEIWDFGIRLYEAWFHLASAENQDRFRNSDQLGRAPNSTEIGLRIDLQARIESGELLAVGIEAGQTAHNGPLVIGRHFFHEGANLDWDTASLRSHGILFQSIKVGRNTNWRDEPVDSYAISAITLATDDTKLAANSIKRGRPSVFKILQPIIRELKASGQLANQSQKQIHNLIRDLARKKFPNTFHLEHTPDRKTIYKALKANELP